MNRPKRNRIEIIAEILRIARPGARTSRIVYKANLNFKQFRGYRRRLEQAGLLEKAPTGWKTTERGHEYLSQFYGLVTIGGL